MAVACARIEALPLFAGFSTADCEALAAAAEERSAVPGDVLAREGASGYFFFVIEDGVAEVTRDGERVGELGAGDFFGEMALLDGGRRHATVTAATPMTLLAVFGTDFRRLETELPAAAERIRAVMEHRLVERGVA